ncbi:MAG: sugar phosphate isomerase/epimerase [Defluviitaleaceae bacterium]|nr:sugar phosphate isomerase/epimerase [Defluviitaleaceae bacterium]
MLLGGPIVKPFSSPEEWLALVKEMNFGAVYFPLDSNAPDALIGEYAAAARENGLFIAEVGVWRNVLSSDADEARAARDYAKKQLALAERVGARCCVNISGSRGEQWDGPHPANFTKETFDMIVASVREIIDAVKPEKAFYTLEPMAWMYPHTADSYLALIKAVDRRAFAAHFDPVNIIASPADYYRNGEIIREWFEKLGGHIKSCHAKDTFLEGQLTVHLNERRPGLGNLDYRAFIECLEKLPGVPMMTEHMDKQEDVMAADEYIRGIMANR